jgi:hypothetical protein
VFPEPGSPRPSRSAGDIDYSAGVEPRGIPSAFTTASGLRTGRVTRCIACGVARGLTNSKAGELRMSARYSERWFRAKFVSEMVGRER